MLDIKLIRKDMKAVEAKLQTKDPEITLSHILDMDTKLRELKTEVDGLKNVRNDFSKEIGEKKRKGEDAADLMAKVSTMGDTIRTLDTQISELDAKFTFELSKLPNIPMDEIKVHLDPKENVFLEDFNTKRTFDFPFKNHVELNEKLDLFDFKRGAKISGSGFPVYKNLGARLEWALIQYMIEMQVKNGFMQWIPPLLVRRETAFGSGQLPKFENQQFKITDEDYDLFLIPTAEIPLSGLHSDEVIASQDLPLKYVAYSPCFRREAGAAGSQERGLIRMHQFNKVELFCFTEPQDSAKVFDMMVKSAESILKGLNIHYRNMLLVTGDTSFASAKTIDIEVWLPGQNRYYEVSSVSNCTDYQARRSNIRYKTADGKLDFVHTLNGSGLATSRLMVAILENNQNADGSVDIPEVLQKYLGGLKKLVPVS